MHVFLNGSGPKSLNLYNSVFGEQLRERQTAIIVNDTGDTRRGRWGLVSRSGGVSPALFSAPACDEMYYIDAKSSEPGIGRARNIAGRLRDLGVSDDDLEIASEDLLLALYLSHEVAPNSIMLSDFDFPDEGGCKERIESDLRLLSKLVWTARECDVAVMESKYANCFIEWLKNSARLSRPASVFLDLTTSDLTSLHEETAASVADFAGQSVFATLTSGGYEWGTIALATSIRRLHDQAIVVLHDGTADVRLIDEMTDGACTFVNAPVLFIADKTKIATRYHNTLSKFLIFALSCAKRVVFIDSDMILLRDFSELLHATGRARATYSFENPRSKRYLQSSVMSVEPGLEQFVALCSAAVSNHRYKGTGDHGYFIDHFKGEWDQISDVFNVSHMVLTLLDKIPEDVRAVHYHGFKPWDNPVGRGSFLAATATHRAWYENLDQRQLVRMVSDARAQDAAQEGRRMMERYTKHWDVALPQPG